MDGSGSVFASRPEVETKANKKLFRHFVQRDFTEAQAKIKLVLEDKRFSSTGVGMKNVSILNSDVAAVLDKTKLTRADIEVFNKYAEATCRAAEPQTTRWMQAAAEQSPYVPGDGG